MSKYEGKSYKWGIPHKALVQKKHQYKGKDPREFPLTALPEFGGNISSVSIDRQNNQIPKY